MAGAGVSNIEKAAAIRYESVLGPITIAPDESVERGTARLMQSWRVVHVHPETFEQIKAECIALGLDP